MRDFSLNKAFVKLRKLLGKSQSHFAALLGCSRDAVISVENRRNGVSYEMNRLVIAAFGAQLSPNGKIFSLVTWEPYELRHYEMWGNSFNASDMKELAEECCEWLTMMFKAAAVPGFAGLKNRLLVLVESFIQWAVQSADELKLRSELDKLVVRKRSLEKAKDLHFPWDLTSKRKSAWKATHVKVRIPAMLLQLHRRRRPPSRWALPSGDRHEVNAGPYAHMMK